MRILYGVKVRLWTLIHTGTLTTGKGSPVVPFQVWIVTNLRRNRFCKILEVLNYEHHLMLVNLYITWNEYNMSLCPVNWGGSRYLVDRVGHHLENPNEEGVGRLKGALKEYRPLKSSKSRIVFIMEESHSERDWRTTLPKETDYRGKKRSNVNSRKC